MRECSKTRPDRDMVECLKSTCKRARKLILKTIHEAAAGHTGGSLSAVEILTALYFDVLRIDPADPDWPDRDRFILSKGHATPAYYATLAMRGFFPVEKLAEFDRIDSMLQGHPCMLRTPGVDMSAGSLGQGLSVGIGMCLGRDMRGQNFRAYVLMGDGECQEGQVWEAAMFAGVHAVRGLIAIVDYNKVQLTGRSADVLDLEPLEEKWRAFRWTVVRTDGNDIEQVLDALATAREHGQEGPVVVIADTVKGCGVSFMEGKSAWHGRAPDDAEFARAMAEIKERY